MDVHECATRCGKPIVGDRNREEPSTWSTETPSASRYRHRDCESAPTEEEIAVDPLKADPPVVGSSVVEGGVSFVVTAAQLSDDQEFSWVIYGVREDRL